MLVEPERRHRWLEKLVGDWTSKMECKMGPGQPLITSTGTETVRPLGGLWTTVEGEGEVRGGGTMKSIRTLGYDRRIERFVGTFVASVMTHLWVYRRTLDEAEEVLTLDTEGPDSSQKNLAQYKDIIRIVDANNRVMTSQTLGEDGKWNQFMTVRYSRKV